MSNNIILYPYRVFSHKLSLIYSYNMLIIRKQAPILFTMLTIHSSKHKTLRVSFTNVLDDFSNRVVYWHALYGSPNICYSKFDKDRVFDVMSALLCETYFQPSGTFVFDNYWYIIVVTFYRFSTSFFFFFFSKPASEQMYCTPKICRNKTQSWWAQRLHFYLYSGFIFLKSWLSKG